MKAGGYACSLTCMAGDSAFFWFIFERQEDDNLSVGLRTNKNNHMHFCFLTLRRQRAQ